MKFRHVPLPKLLGTALIGALLTGATDLLAEPDLIVTEIRVAPASGDPSHQHVAGQPQHFSATIQNVGKSATPEDVIHGVSFWVEGQAVNWSDTWNGSLDPGESVTVSANSGPWDSPYWTFEEAGTYEVEAWVDDVDRIDESDETNNRLSRELLISQTSGEGFQAWRTEHFDADQLEDPEVSGPHAQPLGDGTPNLLKYAIGIAPWTPAVTRLPQADEEDGQILLTYTRLQDAPDVAYQIEYSKDLVTWNPAGDRLEMMATEEDGDTETVTVRLTEEATAADRGFLRMRVSLTSGETWEWRHAIPEGGDLFTVAYDNGHYVAAGEGVAWRSSDGATWESTDWPEDAVALDAVRGVGFVAVGPDGIWSSDDGESWILRVNQAFRAVTWTGEGYVAAGAYTIPNMEVPHNWDPAVVRTSDFGVVWAEQPGIDDDAIVNALAASPERIVAAGGRRYAGRTAFFTVQAWASDDGGVTWERGEMDLSGDFPDESPTRELRTVEWADEPGRFVAAGDGYIFASEDGLEWTRVASPVIPQALAWNGRTFLGVSGDRTVWSEDGITWWEGSRLPAEVNDVAWGESDGRWVAVGDGEAIVTLDD
jgi:hypothetical protein